MSVGNGVLSGSRTIRIRNSTRGTVLGERIRVADNAWSRFIGLIGTASMPEGSGLLIYPSQGVHTIGMAFPIDVIFLDRKFKVRKLRENLRPFRMTSIDWHTSSVLELPSSAIKTSATEVDDQLEIESVDEQGIQ